MKQKLLQPIDDLVLAGFQDKISKQFGCTAYLLSSNEDTLRAQLSSEGRPLKYPYIFLKIKELAETNSYNRSRTVKGGFLVYVQDNDLVAGYVRVVPTSFTCEVTYVTNLHLATKSNSVMDFCRRWLIGRNQGALNFTVAYGQSSFNIACDLVESLPIEQRENAPENVTEYRVVTQAIINGYISDPYVKEIPVIQQVAINFTTDKSNLKHSKEFIPFPQTIQGQPK